MPDFGFRVMTWMYKLVGLFADPRKRLDRVPLKPGMAVVDYACGPGRYTIEVAKRVEPGGRVYAVDVQPLATRMVKDKATRLGLENIETILIDSYDTGIPNSCADLVLHLDAFHQIGDRTALLKEIHRILKPDGIFYLEPGHMKLAGAREIVAASGLFRLTWSQGHDMQFAPQPTP